MPIFTSLLFLFLALALWPIVSRSNARRELERRRNEAEQRLETAARICEAAARDAFHISLDHSIASIDWLDEMIDKGWMEPNNAQGSTTDSPFAIGAYLGDVFVRHHLAVWNWESGKTLLFFALSKRTVSPFELIEQKLREPFSVNLSAESARWQSPEIPEPDNALPA